MRRLPTSRLSIDLACGLAVAFNGLHSQVCFQGFVFKGLFSWSRQFIKAFTEFSLLAFHGLHFMACIPALECNRLSAMAPYGKAPYGMTSYGMNFV
ncbi:MAG: Uncharacterised protein [Prochlorococcus marinus str. MIT 9215]|nr:MAG: Uncharacterised protein [Prochlorococcus marinus str. MIT 9215]